MAVPSKHDDNDEGVDEDGDHDANDENDDNDNDDDDDDDDDDIDDGKQTGRGVFNYEVRTDKHLQSIKMDNVCNVLDMSINQPPAAGQCKWSLSLPAWIVVKVLTVTT